MINIGIVGYGNLGRGLETSLQHNPDYNLAAIFTRRQPDQVKTQTGVPVIHLNAGAGADAGKMVQYHRQL